LVVVNKTDLGRAFTAPAGMSVVATALSIGQGLDELRRIMVEMLGAHADLSARPHAVISERHRQGLLEAARELEGARQRVRSADPTGHVPAASHLRAALEALGGVTGREYGESLLDAIFGRFCIGK
jgi:tRNA modification GTPase